MIYEERIGRRRRLIPAGFFGGLLAWLLAIFLLAASIHIVVIFLVPRLASSDGWSKLAAVTTEAGFTLLPPDGQGPAIAGLDPLFVHGACRISLKDAPASLSFSGPNSFWSLALYQRRGTVLFSVNDRTAIDGRLDMLIVDPIQNAQLKETTSAALDQTIVVEAAQPDLIALVRFYAPTPRERQVAIEHLQAAECVPAPLEPAG
ncbi:DUF1254 domain-containing protein [Afifella aestuarii]|uniref:DUF1254 domain-containing protein n=1 Tax=Afifella aestuarii TaxID=1909496 RepID=UPI000FE39571|nr:hypothetical protein [Afifella aestuarii]